MSDTLARTQTVFTDYQIAKEKRRRIQETVKDAMANDSAYSAAEDEAKEARGVFKAERDSFKAKNAGLFEQLADAKAAEKEAKTIFDEHYEAAVARGEHTQLELFDASGQKVLVTLTTKLAIEKETPTADANDEAGA